MMKTFVIFLVIMGFGTGAYWFTKKVDFNGNGSDISAVVKDKNLIESQNMKATIETNKGNIEVEFLAGDAPETVENFIKLSQKGFYDRLTFHRVIPGFMIQGGDPNCSAQGADKGFCGGGGPGYEFNDEIDASSELYKSGYKKGILAMANSGPNTNGSQFFIMVADYPLPPNYTIFGRVTAGQDVADVISKVQRNRQDRPLEAVVMKSVTVSE